jgi:O-antigen ligase
MNRKRDKAAAVVSTLLLGALLVIVALRPVDAIEVDRGSGLFLFPIALAFFGAAWIAARDWRWTRNEWVLVGSAVGFCFWTALSWWVNAGNTRQGANELWWWCTAVLIWLGARCWLANADNKLRQACLVLTVACAAGQACFAAHQQWVSLPADRALYEANPEAFVRELGRVPEEGSAEWAIIRGRLYEGGPTGTFALANSLAGYLVLGVVIACGMAWRNGGRGWDLRRCGGLVIALAILVALLWTRSNSALVALVAGLGILGLGERFFSCRSQVQRMGMALGAGCVVLGMAVGTLWQSGWERFPRSLAFRFQYWRATLAMIGDSWLWGSGPGNFQDRYLKYRMDEASEGIADPHNWIMEILATAGVPGGAMVLVVLAIIAYRMSARKNLASQGASVGSRSAAVTRNVKLPSNSGNKWGQEDNWGQRSWVLGSGAWLGWLAVIVYWVNGRQLPNFDALALGTLGAVAAWFVLRGRLGDVAWEVVLALAGSVVLGIHLLVAGGISVPGLAVPLLVLLAMLEGNLELGYEGAEGRTQNRKALVGLACLASGLLWLWWWSSWHPVQEQLRIASQAEGLFAGGRPLDANRLYRQAAMLDPWDPIPQMRVAETELWQTMMSGESISIRLEGERVSEERQEQDWQQALDQAVARNPQAPIMWQWLTEQWMTYYQYSGDAGALEKAREAAEQWIELSPTDIAGWAQVALLRGGDVANARRAWERVDQLSVAGGHTERQLNMVRVMAAERIGPAVVRSGVVRRPADSVSRQ